VKWLITGAAGMVGTDLQSALAIRGEDFLPLKRSDLDITDSRAVTAAVVEAHPSIIVNCAGYTRVDSAETNERLANAINGSSVELLAQAAN
jgi:dTDP-4-dehydrorhamnose reductase